MPLKASSLLTNLRTTLPFCSMDCMRRSDACALCMAVVTRAVRVSRWLGRLWRSNCGEGKSSCGSHASASARRITALGIPAAVPCVARLILSMMVAFSSVVRSGGGSGGWSAVAVLLGGWSSVHSSPPMRSDREKFAWSVFAASMGGIDAGGLFLGSPAMRALVLP
jgi:hypothetical protein